MNEALKHRINAGRVAVKNQVDFFHAQLGQVPSEWKEDETRVTFADFAISERILRELAESFPKDNLCSEESVVGDEPQVLTGKYTWLLDPVDGTNNYAAGLPLCSISLALLSEGLPVYGFVYDALRRKLMEGGPGCGVRDGGTKVGMTKEVFGKHSMVALHFPMSAEDLERCSFVTQGCKVRSLGSSALNLAYVAAGYLDGVIDVRPKVWDIAAGMAMLEGAGGRMCFRGESPFPLKRFDPANMPFCPYHAGSEGFIGYFD